MATFLLLLLLTTGAAVCAATDVTVKVLVYNGADAGSGGVAGIKYCLDYSNQHKLTPNVTFSYGQSAHINNGTLAAYDVLAMPGGDSGYSYLHNANIDGNAIVANVKGRGLGYYGTCAGAFSACSETPGYYKGWGVAPNVVCHSVSYEGPTLVKMTAEGKQLLGFSELTLQHWNGPAMDGGVSLGTYGDSKTGFPGKEALVLDALGNGRTALTGPHPELEGAYRHCQVVSHLMAWVAKKM